MPLAGPGPNAAARSLLLRALERRRLPHALLFHGPRGVGKRSAALALAQALLCPNASPATSFDACGSCDTCRRASQGIHPDLTLLEREGSFVKVESARELVRESYLRPYEGRAKVFVVPEAERFNEDSANTLLKTLEEPPPSTYLVLVTSSREAVLPTLRSRCQAIAFTPLGRAELAHLLVEAHDRDPAEADLGARLAAGSEATALAFDLDEVRASRSLALDLLRPLARGEMTPAVADRLVETADRVAGKDSALDLFLLEVLRSIARDALVLAEGGPRSVLVHVDVADRVEDLARSLGPARASALLADVEQAEADLRQNANRKLLVEAVLLGVYERALA